MKDLKLELINPFSALPSWMGFEYQAHIAINTLLLKIKENFKNIEEYILEIEGAEDFSIKKGNKYTSLHQVKYTDPNHSTSSKDKVAFILSLLQYDADGYYHYPEKFSIKKNFVSKSIIEIEKLINECKKEIVKSEDEIEEKNWDKYIIINFIRKDKKKASLYGMIKYQLEKEKLSITFENTKKIVGNIQKALENYKSKLHNNSNKIYEDSKFIFEPNKQFDDIESCKIDSKKIIELLIQKNIPKFSLIINDKRLEVIYNHIINKLHEELIFAEKEKKQSAKIHFINVWGIINTDYTQEQIDTDYTYYEIWGFITHSLDMYIKRTCEKRCNQCNEDKTCNLFYVFNRIEKECSINKKKLQDFIRKLFLSIPNNQNRPDINLVKRLFIDIIKKIPSLKYGSNKLILSRKEDKIYRLTIDGNGELDDFLEKINCNHNKEKDRLLLYEADVLITDQLEYENVKLENNIMTIGNNEFTDVASITSDSIEKHRIDTNRTKIIELINRRTAERRLNF